MSLTPKELHKLQELENENEDIPGPQARPEHIMAKARAVTNAIGLEVREDTKYQLNIPMRPSQTLIRKFNDVNSLVAYMMENAPKSVFRGEIEGLATNENKLIPTAEIDDSLPKGEYKVQFSTMKMNDEDLAQQVFDAVERLNQERQLYKEEIKKLETTLLTTKFTHASLTQEGSTISLEEVVLLANSISQHDYLHHFSDYEMNKLVESTTSSETEVIEAVNHIQVSQQIQDFIENNQLDNNTLLTLHCRLMDRLLVHPSEGRAGEYRKVGITIHNSTVPRAHSQEVEDRMRALFVTMNHGQRETEDITEYLARIHTEFQIIHPFRDGNGRIGRVIMNIIAMKKGFPVIFFTPQQQSIFWEACDNANTGKRGLFCRMLLEALYASLREYETVVPNLLQK